MALKGDCLRGIFDQVQLQGVQQPRFIDQFSDQMAAPIQPQLTNEFADLLQADTFWIIGIGRLILCWGIIFYM